jgi:hypothetical protein
MKVERVYVVCCRSDVWFTRICVASIRYWHPDVPITLVKDETRRTFDTAEIEKAWNVDSRSVEARYGGWAMAHFDLLFNAPEQRFMFLDSDIAFVGPVLDAVESTDSELIVSSYPIRSDAAGLEALKRDYYDLQKLREYDRDFVYPGEVFNCGAMVTGRGIFKPASFGDLMSWDPRPEIKVKGIFQMADQGLFNYVAAKRRAKEEISIASVPFMLWSRDVETELITIDAIRRRTLPPKLIHWAGNKGRLLSRNPRTDILRFFEDEYYRPLGARGKFKRAVRTSILWTHQIRTDIRLRRKAKLVERKQLATGKRAILDASVSGRPAS